MKSFLPALLLLATPACAADEADRYVLFPSAIHEANLRDLVRFEVYLAQCPAIKRTPKASKFWARVRDEPRSRPVDEGALKDFVRYEIHRVMTTKLASISQVKGWCDGARLDYGIGGSKGNGTIANRDGTEARPKCYHEGTCLTSYGYDW